MNLLTAAGTCLDKAADYKGRASRSEFWYFVLFIFLLIFFFGFFLLYPSVLLSEEFEITANATSAVLALFAFYPITIVLIAMLTVTVRRLHDLNRSAWWLLVLPGGFVVSLVLDIFVPVDVSTRVGSIVWAVFIVFLCVGGTKGPNRFGRDPLDSTAPDETARSPSPTRSFAFWEALNGFCSTIKVCIKHTALLRGRSKRLEYWRFQLFLFLVFLAAAIAVDCIVGFLKVPAASAWLSYWRVLVPTVLLWMSAEITVSVRRLHDADMSGWWLLLWLIPVVVGQASEILGWSLRPFADLIGIYFFVSALVLIGAFCRKGTLGDNRFGPDPLAANSLSPTGSSGSE